MMIYYYIPLLNLKETSPVDQKYGIKYFIILTAFIHFKIHLSCFSLTPDLNIVHGGE